MESEWLLSVVIPVYRSQEYLADTVATFVAHLEPRVRFEIVLVNDGSPDRVADVIERLCQADSRVRAISLGKNLGQHRATLRGFAMVRGDVVVTVDDDGQNPPESALEVARALVARNLDVVYGRFQSVEQHGRGDSRRASTAGCREGRSRTTSTRPSPTSGPSGATSRARSGASSRRIPTSTP